MKKTFSMIVIVIVFLVKGVPRALPLLLPASVEAAAPAAVPAAAPLAVVLLLSAGGDTVQATPQAQRIAIVIDDQADFAETVAGLLRDFGFTVETCLTFCDNAQAELFLVDAQDHNRVVGPGFVQKLRASHPKAFIIGMTSKLNFIQFGATLTVKEQFLTAGANVAVSKFDVASTLRSLFTQ